MQNTSPFISICIPAYNRVNVLSELLDSIISQDFDDYEVLICEDQSPERNKIRCVIDEYCQSHPGRIRYQENITNLGYDGNLRTLVENAKGEFCLFMGNDDLMFPGSLAKVKSGLLRHPNVGVLLRSYANFRGNPENITQTFRYFDEERFFPSGAEAIITLFRRSVVISGMVLHRNTALKWSTDRFDGTLLYQLYLVANILCDMNAVYIPDIIALYREGGIPDFGNSKAESGKFKPQEQTIESSLNFMQGMLNIAEYVELQREIPIYEGIVRDIANYIYPILVIQSGRPLIPFLKYCLSLANMGLGRYPIFYGWFIALLLLRPRGVDYLIKSIKNLLGYTPKLGNVYQGERAN